MSALYVDAHPLRRLVRRIAATAPASYVLARTLHHADRSGRRIAAPILGVMRLVPS